MRNRTFGQYLHAFFLTLLLLLTLFPFYMMMATSFKHKVQMNNNFWGISFPLQVDNYATAFQQVFPFILNSIIVTAGIVIGCIAVSSMAGYSFARFDFPGKSLLFLAILALMMIPGFLLLIPQFLVVKDLGMLNTYQGQIFPPMASISAMATLLTRTFFEGIPGSLLEASEMEGAGELRIFARIVLPLSLPVISTVAIISGITGWNNYIWPLVIVTDNSVKPVIIALANITGHIEQGLGVKLAGYIIASLPVLILFLVSTRSFTEGLTAGAVKG